MTHVYLGGFMEISSDYYKEINRLNHIEQFLKCFLADFPEYKYNVIGINDNSGEDYDRIYALLKKYWDKKNKSENFFLDRNSYYIKEDFFYHKKMSPCVKI